MFMLEQNEKRNAIRIEQTIESMSLDVDYGNTYLKVTSKFELKDNRLAFPVLNNLSLTQNEEETIFIETAFESGKTPEEIKSALIQKYGTQILLSPPVDSNTYLLWIIPFFIFALSTIILGKIFLRRKPNS